MEDDGGNIVIMPILESIHALLGLIIPDLDLAVITARHDVWSFIVMTEINAVHTGSMA